MDCHLVVDTNWLLEWPEFETLTLLNQQIAPQDMPILGKGGKFELISDLDDKTNFVFSRNRQKNLASTERAEVKH